MNGAKHGYSMSAADRDEMHFSSPGWVTGVDLSPSGVRDLMLQAKQEKLAIRAEVADIRDHDWDGPFDVIIVDRTLHMLSRDERVLVLRQLLELTVPGSHILIADERSNLPAFKAVLDEAGWDWSATLERRGFLFVARA